MAESRGIVISLAVRYAWPRPNFVTAISGEKTTMTGLCAAVKRISTIRLDIFDTISDCHGPWDGWTDFHINIVRLHS